MPEVVPSRRYYVQGDIVGAMMEQSIVFEKYNYIQTPPDVLDYAERLGGICGEAAIAALLNITVKKVFETWGIDEKDFKGFTIQKDMRKILEKFGYDVKQKKVEDKFRLPNCDFGIIRVSFGDLKQHYMITANRSHYIAIQRFQQGRYIYDNAISQFNGNPVNGVWIEESEYYKVMANEKMFITSYLELKEKVKER